MWQHHNWQSLSRSANRLQLTEYLKCRHRQILERPRTRRGWAFCICSLEIPGPKLCASFVTWMLACSRLGSEGTATKEEGGGRKNLDGWMDHEWIKNPWREETKYLGPGDFWTLAGTGIRVELIQVVSFFQTFHYYILTLGGFKTTLPSRNSDSVIKALRFIH